MRFTRRKINITVPETLSHFLDIVHENRKARTGSTKTPGPPAPRLHDTVRLSADGIAKVLGDLEARVLQTIWALQEPATARAVHDAVVIAHAVSPLTTITVLNKLVAKRILTRKKVDDVFRYAATMTEDAFRSMVSRRVVEGILSFGPEAVSASLVDVLAERNPEQLEELGRLIRRRLREQG